MELKEVTQRLVYLFGDDTTLSYAATNDADKVEERLIA